MHSVHFSSPNGAHLEFDMDGVHLAGLGDQKPTDKHPLTGHQQYGDILFVEKYSKVNFLFRQEKSVMRTLCFALRLSGVVLIPLSPF